ncbi:MAG: Vitamin B12-dependent ribonucleotide reductase, partial [Bdellovibrionales bacterium]|nr:Vitamin B12-dependent ribonucleotide reductase [Bdellovibrionales bacterium]
MGTPVNGAAAQDSAKKSKDKRDAAAAQRGLQFRRHFTIVGKNPFDEATWETRDVSILDDSGQAVFSQHNVEVPAFWSQTALTVVASKYFAGEHGSPKRESSIRTLVSRVVETITGWGIKQNYFANSESSEAFKAELTHILLNQYASFNSPVWFNVGVREQPQCSACFILSVDDDMDSLLQLQTREGRLFKWGSGTGSNLSSIRSSKEKLSGGGTPSGPVSFMRAYDAWANIIKSGGKTRRAAKMQILNAEHPDIEEFVDCKAGEEKKAWALIEQGYDPGFAVAGGAYDSVAFQNANLSVRVTDEFMRAAVNDELYWTKNVVNGQPCEQLSARAILEKIAEGTYICGDPGIQFDTTINDWHTCPATGRINASNPCSEYMHLDNSACNLSSINLLKFLETDGSFNSQDFRHVVDVMITAQDILIDNASYPFEEVADCAHKFRQLGLGYANLGAFLMSKGLPYDSDAGREWAAVLTALMTGQAYKASAKIAAGLEPFEGFKPNRQPMLDVIRKHRDSLSALHLSHIPSVLRDEAAAV